MIAIKVKKELENSKNLLAFSAGVDSSALFFILMQNNIKFDIAIVDYGLREQSKYEVLYAKELAKTYNKKCFIKNVPKIEKNFEANAREERYTFFHNIISTYNYQNLLTAHHLGDRFEWMLMQFCKGSGCVELSGMKQIEKRENFKLIRPLLNMDKQELLIYLKENNIKYFEDESNNTLKYKRNIFRHRYSNPMLNQYLDGIKRSFKYIDEDVENLITEIKIKNINQFAYFKTSTSLRTNIYTIDKYLKKIGHIMTSKEKEQLKNLSSLIVGRKYIISKINNLTTIAPYIKISSFDKKFKEKMRKLKIEPKLRGYLSLDKECLKFVQNYLFVSE